MVMAWGHMLSIQPLERLGVKVSHAGGQLCLCDQTSIKTLDTKTWVFPCLTTPHAYSHTVLLREASTGYTAHLGADTWQFCT